MYGGRPQLTKEQITGATDGGIVIFGSPGSHILCNTIVSTSSSGLQFGGINMVDPTWGGNYTGVVVSSNTITGGPNSFINLGIGMGSQVWSNPHPETNFGQVTVINNVFTGNIGFSIVMNGWLGGLTVTGNSVSGVTTPSSSFASAAGCGAVQQASFAASEQLVYYPAGVTGSSGPNTIQSQFTALATNASNWLCLTNPPPLLPDTKSFLPNTLSVDASTSRVVSLRDFHVQVQGDGNVVGIDTTGGRAAVDVLKGGAVGDCYWEQWADVVDYWEFVGARGGHVVKGEVKFLAICCERHTTLPVSCIEARLQGFLPLLLFSLPINQNTTCRLVPLAFLLLSNQLLFGLYMNT